MQVSNLGILVGLVLEVLSLVTAQILLSLHEASFELLEGLAFTTNVSLGVVHLVGGVFPVDLALFELLLLLGLRLFKSLNRCCLFILFFLKVLGLLVQLLFL